MYVDYETFANSAFGGMTADEYEKAAPLADLLIDHYTLGRVGRCFEQGHDLPASVETAYCAIAAAVPAAVEESATTGGKLTSFSNGVNSYGFSADGNVLNALTERTEWVLSALPVEWVSAAVCYEGGCHA